MSRDKENEYFIDGLAEEILNLLAKIPALKVIARTSFFAFRGKERDIRRIVRFIDRVLRVCGGRNSSASRHGRLSLLTASSSSQSFGLISSTCNRLDFIGASRSDASARVIPPALSYPD